MKLVLRVLILFLILFLATVDNQMLLPLLPLMEEDLAVTVSTLGLLISGYALAAAVFSIFLGPFTDRYGRVLFFRLGLGIFLLSALLSYLTPGFLPLLGLRALTGLAAGLLSTCTASYIGDQFPYQSRGRIMGIVLSSYFAATILGIPAGAALADSVGWRSVFLATAAGAAALVMASWLLPSDKRSGSEGRSVSFSPRQYTRFLAGRDTLAALWVSFAISGGTVCFLAYVSPYLSSRFGLSSLQISQIFAVAGAAALVGSPLAGWLSDRLTKRSVFLVANTALALPLLALTLIGWGWGFFAAVFLIGLGIAFRQTALQTLQTELAETEGRGTFIALRNGFSQMGIATAVFLGGRLYAEWGYPAVTVLAASLTLLASILMLAAVRQR
ncbi:MAG TPA: MFS transporter [Acidobacteriota bacterium]|nr:MFS transporter [Acidobacteriota bacterium]